MVSQNKMPIFDEPGLNPEPAAACSGFIQVHYCSSFAHPARFSPIQEH